MTSITSVKISKTIVSIGRDTFFNTGITELFIPKNVKVLVRCPFGYCPYLRKVEFEFGINITFSGIDLLFNNPLINEIIFPIDMTFPDGYSFEYSNVSKMYICSLDAVSSTVRQFHYAKIPKIYVRKAYKGTIFMGIDIERMENDSICYYNRPNETKERYYFRLVASFFGIAFFPAILQDRVFISIV